MVTERSSDPKIITLKKKVSNAVSMSSLNSETASNKVLGPKKIIIPRNQIQVGSGSRIVIKPKEFKPRVNPLAEESKSAAEEQIDTRKNTV